VWASGGAEAQPGGIHQKIAKKWSEENPDTPIRIEILPDEADQQREQQALELQAEGSNFDVLGVDVIWTGEYSTNGWLGRGAVGSAVQLERRLPLLPHRPRRRAPDDLGRDV
jgi:ABC-type glycerol-3-phosphate transport system substrate-binding protein